MADPRVIGPVLQWLVDVLKNMTPAQYGGLEPFAEVHQSWTWTFMNWPPVGVLPRTSTFDPEIMGATHSANELTVRFGVNGADPDQLMADAIAYMLAIDAAIQAAATAAPCPNSMRVFISAHDYGPMFGGASGGGFAKFPELHLTVEVTE